MNDTTKTLKLSQKPCILNYLEECDLFIIGTYELVTLVDDARIKLNFAGSDQQIEKKLYDINSRAGKLILIRENDNSDEISVVYDYDCHRGGGVFDLKYHRNNITSDYDIFVAHSNGSVGIYGCSPLASRNEKIWAIKHIQVQPETILTSIDTLYMSKQSTHFKDDTSDIDCKAPNSARFVVGDSKGFIALVKHDENPTRLDVAQGDSVWQVRCVNLSTGNAIVIVGAENCAWYIYRVENEGFTLLYKNHHRDFDAGVTCISILNQTSRTDCDELKVILGSYDESLQVFAVSLYHNVECSTEVSRECRLCIANGGIWRVKVDSRRSQLCVAAMYAGSYLISYDSKKMTLADNAMTRKLVDASNLNLENAPLHYDIDVSSRGKSYCMVDFNNNLCLLVRQQVNYSRDECNKVAT